MTTGSPMSDAELISDLETIEAEMQARKKAGEPFAAWALFARMDAMKQFWLRNGLVDANR